VSVLVVGSLHLDVVLRAPHLPSVDETVAGTGVDYVFGGKGGNQALAAARMGAAVHLVARAGQDRFGDIIRDTLEASSVDLSQLQLDPGPSGMSAAIVNDAGEYGAVIVSAANLNIDVSQVIVPEQTSVVILQNEIPQQVNLAMAQKARKTGARVWLNAAPARELPDALVELMDLLIVNRVEAAFYGPQTGTYEVLTTLGGNGVSYRDRLYPAHNVDVVSAHGAGDMFVGALAAQVDLGKAMPEAIGFAQTAAALHVASGLSERPQLDADSVAAFLAAQPNR
jgi:ribokinase